MKTNPYLLDTFEQRVDAAADAYAPLWRQLLVAREAERFGHQTGEPERIEHGEALVAAAEAALDEERKQWGEHEWMVAEDRVRDALANRRMTFKAIEDGDRVRLTRSLTRYAPEVHYPAGSVGTVTLKSHDGLRNTPLVRVRFDGLPGEPFIDFPTAVLEYAT